MTEGQQAEALICALIGKGIPTSTIYEAAGMVRDVPLGTSISALADPHDLHLARAFAQEQVRRMRGSRPSPPPPPLKTDARV